MQEKRVAAQKLRDAPDGETTQSLERQVTLLNEALAIYNSTKTAHTDKHWWESTGNGLLWMRGAAYAKQGKYTEAINDYTTHLKNTSENNAALMNSRGLAKRERGDIDGALSDFLISAGLDKGSGYYNRAQLFRKLGRFEDALKDCQLLLQHAPDAAYNQALMAKIQRDMGDYETAIFYAKAAVRKDNKNAVAHTELGIALREYRKGLGKVPQRELGEQAIDAFTEAIALAPKEHTAYGYRALTFFELGQYAKAQKDFAQARVLMKEKQKDKPAAPQRGFNTLEYAVWDETKKQLLLFGKDDPKYPGAAIPYYDVLQTAWTSPNPGFSLDISPASRQKLDRLIQRFSAPTAKVTEAESKRAFEKMGDQVLTLMQLLFADVPDEKGGLSPMNPRQNTGGYVTDALFWEWTDAYGVRKELETILAGKATEEIHNAAVEKFFGIQNGYTRIKNLIRARDEQGAMRFVESLPDKYFAKFQESALFFGPRIIGNILTDKPNAIPRYDRVPANSQLARILFESDVALKLVTSLDKDIPGHHTHLSWLLSKKQDVRRWVRFWITPEHVRVALSPDGNTFSFSEPKLAIQSRVEDGRGGEFNEPATAAYAAFLTERYDTYAQRHKPLHELREASKVLALAHALKTKGIILQPLIQETWQSPEAFQDS